MGGGAIKDIFKVLAGTHEVAMSDGTPAKLKVRGTADNPVCELTYRVKSDGKKMDVYLLDNGCDGVDVIRKRTGGKKWQEERVTSAYFNSPEGNEMMKMILLQYMSLRAVSEAECCEVKFKKAQAEIFFDTGTSTLMDEAKGQLDKFVKEYEGGPVIIEGYCDWRGDVQFNFELGVSRAETAARYLTEAFEKAGKPLPEFTIISYGETRPTGKSMQKDRRAVITSGENIVKRALDATMAASPDIYLVDASRSMIPYWGTIRDYHFPKGTKAASFNSCRRVSKGIGSPGCGTPLWDSLHETIGGMGKGKRVAVITDGEDTTSIKVGPGDIISLAKKKDIAITIIYVGPRNEDMESWLSFIATETGGAIYLKTN